MNDEKPRLGRDIYIALAAVGWADGNLDQEEADAIVRTALEEGLELDEIEEIETATKERVDIGVIDRKDLSNEDRLFVYAVACWLATLDGVVTEGEESALMKLGEALRIPDRPRQNAFVIAREVASLPEGDRPDRYDLVTLRKIINHRLAMARARRDAASER